MLKALAILLGLQLVGEVVTRWWNLPVPGPVLGMAILLVTLVLRPQWLQLLRTASNGLLQHLSLLFVPAGVGVMLHLQRLGDEAWAIGVALLLSTWLGMASAALTMTWLMRTRRSQPPEKAGGEAE
jgi:holin-like protein